MLRHDHQKPITGARKARLESRSHTVVLCLSLTNLILELRKNTVPRYLFRTWSDRSGGGSGHATNSLEGVIPHGFMKGQGRRFYETPESDLYEMAIVHYISSKERSSVFSSWSASLHLVLRYAEYHGETNNPHIAIIDTKDLDEEVLVVRNFHVRTACETCTNFVPNIKWHVPHFMHARGVNEYMAHGRIAGRGYKAVSLKALKAKGLLEVFPEIALRVCDGHKKCCGWGLCVRQKMFADIPRHLETHELDQIITLAGLFGDLALPVATALICIRPRPWLRRRPGVWTRLLQGRRAALSKEQTVSEVARRYEGAGQSINLRTETWLRHDAVDTGKYYNDDYPDMRQWIDLLRAIYEQDDHTTAQIIRQKMGSKVRNLREDGTLQSANT
jgi:hypothetical protein